MLVSDICFILVIDGSVLYTYVYSRGAVKRKENTDGWEQGLARNETHELRRYPCYH